jgi:hypothetical protein
MIGHSVTHYTWQRTRPDDESDKHCGWVFRESVLIHRSVS